METITVHQSPGGMRYVRIADLPDDQREAFSDYLRGAGMPVVETEVDCSIAFETDYLDFIHHRRSDR